MKRLGWYLQNNWLLKMLILPVKLLYDLIEKREICLILFAFVLTLDPPTCKALLWQRHHKEKALKRHFFSNRPRTRKDVKSQVTRVASFVVSLAIGLQCALKNNKPLLILLICAHDVKKESIGHGIAILKRMFKVILCPRFRETG